MHTDMANNTKARRSVIFDVLWQYRAENITYVISALAQSSRTVVVNIHTVCPVVVIYVHFVRHDRNLRRLDEV